MFIKIEIATHIFDEEIPTSLFTVNASSGQKIVNVVDGSKFVVDQDVIIADDDANETNTIAGISTNELTMLNDLQYNYQTNANAYVSVANNNDRRFLYEKVTLFYLKKMILVITLLQSNTPVRKNG